MNCEDFNDRLYDILDEAPNVPTDAQEHLRQCGACRNVFLREQALAKNLGQSLNQVTANLSLGPETRRNVLKAMEPRPAPTFVWARIWQRLGADLAVAAVLLLGIHLYRRTPANTAAQSDAVTYFIDVPIPTQTQVIRLHNNTIEDATIVTVGHADFSEQAKLQSKQL